VNQVDLASLAFSAGVIVLMVAVHAVYFAIAESYNSQMQLRVGKPDTGALVRLTDGTFDASGVQRCDYARLDLRRMRGAQGARRTLAAAIARPNVRLPKKRRSRMARLAGSVGFSDTPVTPSVPGSFGPARVFDSDVCLEANSTFYVPVKVAGDLEIDGDVEFNEAVIVDGMMVVRGKATFLGGVLVKRDVIVEGVAILDAGIQNSWLVGRKLRGNGILAEARPSHNREPIRLVS